MKAFIVQRIQLVVVVVLMTSMGVESLILGDGVSAAFSHIGGSIIIRVMGTLMLSGAALLLYGGFKKDQLWENIGVMAIVTATAIYSFGVILGLHVQGLIAGQLSLLIAVTFGIQVMKTISAAGAQKSGS